MRCYNHQCFYWDTISRKAAIQGYKDPSLAMRHGYPPPDANLVFQYHRYIIIIVIIIFDWSLIVIIIVVIIIIIILT